MRRARRRELRADLQRAGGRDLDRGDGWASAVLSYNHSDEYVAAVHAAASAYAERAAGRRAA